MSLQISDYCRVFAAEISFINPSCQCECQVSVALHAAMQELASIGARAQLWTYMWRYMGG